MAANRASESADSISKSAAKAAQEAADATRLLAETSDRLVLVTLFGKRHEAVELVLRFGRAFLQTSSPREIPDELQSEWTRFTRASEWLFGTEAAEVVLRMDAIAKQCLDPAALPAGERERLEGKFESEYSRFLDVIGEEMMVGDRELFAQRFKRRMRSPDPLG